MAVSDIAEGAKNAGVILTALSGFAYACGYLVVRARSRAFASAAAREARMAAGS